MPLAHTDSTPSASPPCQLIWPLFVFATSISFILCIVGFILQIQIDDAQSLILRTLLLVLSLLVTPLLAYRKGYSWFAWIMGGGVIGLLVLAFLPYANAPGLTPEQQEMSRQTGNTAGMLISSLSDLIIILFACISVMQ
jgi:hypothetical protein